MGVSFAKSFKLGAVRFSFSGGGIGMSVGVSYPIAVIREGPLLAHSGNSGVNIDRPLSQPSGLTSSKAHANIERGPLSLKPNAAAPATPPIPVPDQAPGC